MGLSSVDASGSIHKVLERIEQPLRAIAFPRESAASTKEYLRSHGIGSAVIINGYGHAA